MDPDRVRYAYRTLRPGRAEEKCQEIHGGGMPPMPGVWCTGRQSLYPEDDGVG